MNTRSTNHSHAPRGTHPHSPGRATRPAALLTSAALAAAATLPAPAAHAALSFDAASAFSPTTNPNGEWSFGSQPTLSGPFSVAAFNGSLFGCDYWCANPAFGLPGVIHNPSASTINFGSSAVFAPGQLILHPGPAGELSTARFTAPLAGVYTFDATFIGQDQIGGTSTDVHLLVNNLPVFSGLVNGYLTAVSSGPIVMALLPGDTIDAAVGFGSNFNYYGDSTGLTFNVDVVPTPATGVLAALGTIVAARRRRHAERPTR